jgi:Mitochondrial carrier protein
MPLTVLKVRYESDLYAYTNLRSAAQGVWRTEGLRGFFTGVGATALRDAPYAGLYVLFYEQAKTSLSQQLDNINTAAAGLDGSGAAFAVNSVGDERHIAKTRVAAPVNFVSGILAGSAATAITNPFDAVKTRLQLRPKEYPNLWRAATLMIRDEGIRSLFDGLVLRMTRKAMSSAIAWTLYEELVRVAEARI